MADTWVIKARFPVIPPELQAISDALKAVSGALKLAAEAEATRAKVLSAARALQDISTFAVDAAALIQSFLLDLLRTDVYQLPVGPFTAAELSNGFDYAAFLRQLEASVADPLDPNRPQFSGQAVTAGVVVLAGAGTQLNLAGFIAFLRGLFSENFRAYWEGLAEKLKAFGSFEPLPPNARVTQGTFPDWYRTSDLGGLFPAVRRAMDTVAGIVTAYDAVGKSAAAREDLTTVADSWARRVVDGISLLEQVLAGVTTLLDQLVAGQGLFRLYVLNLPPPAQSAERDALGYGGTADFIGRVASAGGAPTDNWVAGFVVVLGAPNVASLKVPWNSAATILGQGDWKV